MAQVLKVSQYNAMTGKEGINKLLDLVVERVCANAYKACWQQIFTVRTIICLRLSVYSSQEGLRNKNIYPMRLPKTVYIWMLSWMFYMKHMTYRINYKWQQKIDECRDLVARQPEGISTVIIGYP